MLSLLLVTGGTACGEPNVAVGAIECGTPEPAEVNYDPVGANWSTSFENGFCDYAHASGRCYGSEYATYEVVTAPTHSGRRAAAYSIMTGSDEGEHTRCYLEGDMPKDAIYGAWFYLPEESEEEFNWNLIHVRGGEGPNDSDRIWDVSVGHTEDGMFSLYVRDVDGVLEKRGPDPVPVPIGAWFHVEFRWRRAADETGILALFQDGQLLWREQGRITNDSPWAQWYVGNLAISLTPATSTIYVDDVTVRPAP